MRTTLLAIAFSLLPALASALPPAIFTVEGALLGGGCEEFLVEEPDYAVRVETCTLAVSVDPTLGVGPTVLLCRRETCLFGPCSAFSTLHSGELAGPIELCYEAAQAPLRYRFHGWIGGNPLYVLKLVLEPS